MNYQDPGFEGAKIRLAIKRHFDCDTLLMIKEDEENLSAFRYKGFQLKICEAES